MSYNLILHPNAKIDIREIALWYESKQKGLGKRFVLYLKKEIYSIQKKPLLFEIRYSDTRICITKKFPYLIHFSVYENSIVIKAIFHSSRNPELWKEV